MSELRKVALQMYAKIIHMQDELLRIGHANPGAYYTGNQEIDSRLLRLYMIQSKLESFLSHLNEEVGLEC